MSAPDLDLFAAREARDEAIQRGVEHADDDWKADALATIRRLAESQPTIHPDDVWAAGLEKPSDARRLGGMLLSAASKGWIRRTHIKRQSEVPTNHAHERCVWASNLYRPRNGYEAAGRERKAGALARAVIRINGGTDSGLAERAAALSPEQWNGIAIVAGVNPPSDASVVRAVEILSEMESEAA